MFYHIYHVTICISLNNNVFLVFFVHLNLDAEQLQYAGLFPVHG